MNNKNDITIKIVDSKREINNFIKLHEILYHNGEYYVFPTKKEMKKNLEN